MARKKGCSYGPRKKGKCPPKASSRKRKYRRR
jgi:hypothetical protein